ncbi:MAG TPA: hypothetical protein VG847_17220 [Chitinophagaceae bacterium]|nr:hypothetical protein [Chitinophagaceae bacterium]
MRIFHIAIFAFFLGISSVSFAQSRDSLLNIYNSQTIYRFGNKFVKGNNVLTYEQLTHEFTSPRTLSLYLISKRKAGVARVFNLGSFAVFVVSLFVKTNTAGSIGFAAGTGALSLTGLYFQTQSSMYIERALWEHNREQLFGRN